MGPQYQPPTPPGPKQGSTSQSKTRTGGSLVPTLKTLFDYEPSDEIKKAVADIHGSVIPEQNGAPRKPAH